VLFGTKLLLSLLTIASFSNSAFSKETAEIKGKVIDVRTHRDVDEMELTIMHYDSKKVFEVETDNDGKFLFQKSHSENINY